MIWPTCQSKDLHSFLKARVVKRCEISCNFINPSPKSIDSNKFGVTSFPHLQQRNTSSKLRFILSLTRLLGARKRLLLCTAHSLSMNHPKSYDAASAMVSLRLDTLLKKGLNCESYFWSFYKPSNDINITHPKETIGVALPVIQCLRPKSTGI